MEIISVTPVFPKVAFGQLQGGEVFQRDGSSKLYIKSAHSSGQGGNCARLSNGLRSTIKDSEVVSLRSDCVAKFQAEELDLTSEVPF